MPPTWPFTFRLVTFATTILFSVIVMCLSADLVSMFSSEQFSRLTLATSLLTILTVTPMLIIDKLRQGSILSYAGVEIVWPTILWVLWLTSGSYTAWKDNQFSVIPAEANCDFDFDYGVDVSKYNRFCHEIKAVIGFSFILWILLLAYTFILLVLTLRAKERGHPAWTTSVRDGGILHPTEKPTESAFQMPVAQTHIISTPYVPATQMTTIPQSYSQTPATPAPSYRSPTQRSLSMSVSPSIPRV
ncbi:hypothetical protein BC826DRAFT_1101220 [Russula brevipes]|nr:hypothetical protein BC826DRAFT_1101220 [Russula brevipes]